MSCPIRDPSPRDFSLMTLLPLIQPTLPLVLDRWNDHIPLENQWNYSLIVLQLSGQYIALTLVVSTTDSKFSIIDHQKIKNSILLPKLFWHTTYDIRTVRKNCFNDQEKLLKFEAEGQEFVKILRSLEQFIETVKGQNFFW